MIFRPFTLLVFTVVLLLAVGGALLLGQQEFLRSWEAAAATGLFIVILGWVDGRLPKGENKPPQKDKANRFLQ